MPQQIDFTGLPDDITIDWNNLPDNEPDLPVESKGLWNTINKPLVTMMSPEIRRASQEFSQPGLDSSVLGSQIKGFASGAIEALTDTLSSLTSPLNLGLTATTLGSGTAARLGMARAARLLEKPAKIAAGGMIAEGGYNLVRPEATLLERAGGLLEASLGGLGLRTPKSKLLMKTDVVETPKVEVPKIESQSLLPGLVPETIEPIKPLALPESVIKLRDALTKSVPLNKQQRELYRVERSEKFGKAEDVKVETEADLPKLYGVLKGEHTKVEITPLRESLEQTDVDDLLRTIRRSKLTQPEQINAIDGLQSLLDGRVPTNYDIGQMRRVFGEDFANHIQRPMTLGRGILAIGEGARGLKVAGDFGSPFRQGRNYAYRASWFKSLIPMIRSYGSQRIFDEKMSFIRSDPFFPTAQKMKVDFTDLKSTLTQREESAIGGFVGNLPLVKNSNRAGTIFANNLRFLEAKKQYGVYKTAYESGMKLAKTPDEIAAAKMLNPDNPYVASKLGDQINTATGRGKLPDKLEKMSPELNTILFAPKLMASRIRSINRVLNPVSYWNYNPIERKEALKQLASIAAAGMTEAVVMKQIYNLAGHDATIELSPDSTDFMKVKIENTRYDPFGGYQQYFVPFFKIIMNTIKSTNSGERTSLNEGPFAPGGVGTLVRALFVNKLAPLASFGATILNRQEMGGRELNMTTINPFENTLTRTLANPIILQDLYDVMKEDPTLAPLLIPDMFGQGIDVYEQR